MIADTSFLIDLMRKNGKAIDKLGKLKEDGIRILVPSVVIFELYIGLGRLNLSSEEEAKIQNILNNMIVAPFNYLHAKRAGIELGLLFQKGQPVDPIDAQIAGTALQLDVAVITNNVKHFERFENIKIEKY